MASLDVRDSCRVSDVNGPRQENDRSVRVKAKSTKEGSLPGSGRYYDDHELVRLANGSFLGPVEFDRVFSDAKEWRRSIRCGVCMRLVRRVESIMLLA